MGCTEREFFAKKKKGRRNTKLNGTRLGVESGRRKGKYGRGGYDRVATTTRSGGDAS
jgi:hypothetical protein